MLTIIAKVTEYCNANCIYCAVSDKDRKKSKMTVPTVNLLMTRIAEYLGADQERGVTVTWHGGEPALMGPAFYATVYDAQRTVLRGMGHRLRHSMQSNITLMTQELIDVLLKLGVDHLGTSYDYRPGVRGIGPARDSDTYNRLFFKALNLLKKNGIEAGVIFVVTSHSIGDPEGTLAFLTNLLGKRQRGHFRINQLYFEGEAQKLASTPLHLKPEDFGHFLGKAYLLWYRQKSLLPHVAPFAGVHKAVTTGDLRGLGCEDTGDCGLTHISVNPDGGIFQCGRSMDSNVLRYGHIEQHSFDDILAMPTKQELIERSETMRSSECAACPIYRVCHGGCPVDSFIYTGDWRNKTYFCGARKVFWLEYVLPHHGLTPDVFVTGGDAT